MKTTIPVNGISTTLAYADGDCLSLVNLRKKNGALKPVSPRQVERFLKGTYDALFVHQLPNTQDNWIAIRESKLYWLKDYTYIKEKEVLLSDLTFTSDIPTITQIGNLLNVLDNDGYKHIIWYDNEYKLIDNDFGGTQTAEMLLPIKVDLKVDGNVDSNGNVSTSNYFSEKTTDESIAKKSIYSLYEKAISLEAKDGLITGCALAITAIELFDGSYALHSSPTFLGMPFDENTRYSGIEINETLHDHINNPVGWEVLSSSSLVGAYKNLRHDRYEGYKQNRKPFYGVTEHTNSMRQPYIIGNYFQSTDDKSNRPYVSISANKLKFRISNLINEDFKPLIKSISVFITPTVLPHESYSTIDDLIERRLVIQGIGPLEALYANWFFKSKTDAAIVKELMQLDFYKVHEIAFDDITIGGETPINEWIEIDLKDKLGDNLFMQERLPVDDFTHHRLTPQSQYVYNARLHSLDYKQELFRGWPYPYMECKEVGIGQFPATTYTFNQSALIDWWVEVKIKTTTGTSTVVRHRGTPLVVDEMHTFMPILSYPDSRAYEMTIYIETGGTSSIKNTYKLTASDIHNFAYYINPELKPIPYSQAGVEVTIPVPTELNRTITTRNGLKVSALNNPFYYPAENTYLIGTSPLSYAATNARITSAGETGKFPLYITTEEGIYAMTIGNGEIVYSSVSLISNEIPISNVHTSTPMGVVFIAKRGLYIIIGQEVSFISGALEQEPTALNIALPSIDVVPTASQIKKFDESFMEYLKSATNIAYHHRQNELIISNGEDAFNWVLNIDEKHWYQQTEQFTLIVGNLYPELKVVNGTNLVDFGISAYVTDSGVVIKELASVSLILRPFNFGTTELKQVHRYILRGRLHDAEDLIVMNHSSNDGINFDAVQGNTYDDGNRRDIDMGMIAKSSRHFLFLLAGKMDEDSEITAIDCDAKKLYENDKMR